MSNRRWMKFWPGDWHGDKALRTCSPAARGVWIDLICVAHDGTPYGHVTINHRPATMRQIAAIVGMQEKDASKAIAELEEAGVCSRTEAGAIFSRRMVRDHEASLQGKEWVEKRWANKGEGDRPITTPNRVPNINPDTLEERREKKESRKEEGSLRSLVAPEADAPDFEEFWRAYPRKVGKGAARTAYVKARRKAAPAAILAAVQGARWPASEKYIPHPSTWLAEERWLDERDMRDPVLVAAGVTGHGARSLMDEDFIEHEAETVE